MTKKNIPSIEETISNKWLVEFNRKPLEKYPLYGFIVDFNSDFTLINIFDRDHFILDGYCVFRNTDVKNHAVYNDDNYFLSEVIAAKKIVPNPVPKISISSWQEIVQSVSDCFPLLVVETGRLHKNECYIGTLKQIKKKSFELREIDVDADWDGITKYRFEDLTMIGFGGHYETALALVSTEREQRVVFGSE